MVQQVVQNRAHNCKLCSVGELNKQLDFRSMEIRWNIYIEGVDNKGVIDWVSEQVGEQVNMQASQCSLLAVYW